LRRDLGLADLVWFNIAIVLGVQGIAMSAHIGPVALLLHVLAAVCFFVPMVYVVASLSRRFPGEGGFYAWIREAFGLFPAFLCGWSWWLGVMFFVPVMLLQGAAIAIRVLADAPHTEQHAMTELAVCLAAVWAVTAVNWYGFRVSKWLNDCGSALMYSAGVLVVIACGVSAISRGFLTPLGSVFDFDAGTLGLWAQIAMSYGGLEMGSRQDSAASRLAERCRMRRSVHLWLDGPNGGTSSVGNRPRLRTCAGRFCCRSRGRRDLARVRDNGIADCRDGRPT
jgi:amino acid transporter